MKRPLAAAVTALLVALAGCGDDEAADRGDSGGRDVPLVATLGDSITAGAPLWNPNPLVRERIGDLATPESQWQHWAERALDGVVEFRNCGVNGDSTEQIAERFDECADSAETIVIQGGTNDLVDRTAPAEAAANLREMVRRAHDAGLRTFVATAPPLNFRYPRWAPEIRRLNRLIKQVAREEGVPLIDFFDVLEDPRRPDRMPREWTDDGAHPSVEGYARIGRAAARALAS